MKYLNYEATCKKIQDLAKENGLSVITLSEKMGISTQAIYGWFSDKKKAMPTIDNLVILSSLFECSVDEILCYTEYEEEREY